MGYPFLGMLLHLRRKQHSGDDSMSLFNDADLVLKPTCLFGNGDTMQ